MWINWSNGQIDGTDLSQYIYLKKKSDKLEKTILNQKLIKQKLLISSRHCFIFHVYSSVKTMKFFILILLLIDLINCLEYRSSKELVNQINNELLKHKKSVERLHGQNRTDFRANFMKLVENFLMIHLKKLSNSELNSTIKIPIDDEPDTSQPIGQTNFNIKTSKENLIIIIIILSILSSGLFILFILSCFLNFRQRSRLNFLNENDFFTYYNSKSIPPLISSSSSFSLQPKKVQTPKPEAKLSTIQSEIDSGIGLSKYNSIKRLSSLSLSTRDKELLNKEHMNFINGNLARNNCRSKRIKNFLKNKPQSFSLSTRLNSNQESDDEDVIVEHDLKDDLPKISLNFDAYKPEEIEESNDEKIVQSYSKTNDPVQLDIIELESSSYIRDRYYQILREQVFPYLQKSNNGKPINSLNNNDMLY
ncbi:hypothetical protein BpHYR1_041841 [Brachionus plicatilis]|uniref:Uncharacterized protein n=1 Tax=Brachionus plicatilis TaxID=10195 RepID=A0A3M7QBK9_BRAPC|nr:hypothetical protein BpHYR1_041841 [Brachionus plicatilis]